MNDGVLAPASAGSDPLREPSAAHWRAAVTVAIVYGLIVAGLTPLARLQGPAMPQFVAVFTTGVIVTDVATAFLLLQQARTTPRWNMLLIGSAYLFSALMGAAHLLTFPGALKVGGPILGGDQMAYHVFNTWRAGYAVLVLAGAWMGDGAVIGPRQAPLARIVAWTAAAAPPLMVGVWLLLENRLPKFVVPNGEYTGVAVETGGASIAVMAVCCAWLWTRRAKTSLFNLWVALAMTALAGDMLLSTLGGSRFSLGWYAGRASWLVSASTLLMFFLFQSAAQERLAVQTAEALRERTERLQAESIRRAEAEERLAQAQKLEAMGQLTGGIAHDFNNLLAAVIGNLDLLIRRGGLEPRPAAWAANARGAAERGVKLINQLLVFARSQRLELKPVDVEAVLTATRDILVNAAGPDIAVVLDLAASPRPIVAEPSQLELAVLNLFINARDAMPGGGTIVLSTADVTVTDDPELEPGDYLRLTVADTGAGMEPEVLRRAFDPFFTTKGVGKGTGLGLSQVFGFARRVGGTARAESEPGHGTRVHLYFRRFDGSAPTAERAEADVPPVAVSGPVLVVDDDQAVRELLAALLDELGLQAILAADGFAGLEALQRRRPALLIADFAMPGLNGAKLAERARALVPGLPVLFITGYADTNAIHAAVGDTAPILRKPFQIAELRAGIARALARPAMTPSA